MSGDCMCCASNGSKEQQKAMANWLVKLARDHAKTRSNLQWCYDRLSHLLFGYDHPGSAVGLFGPDETMTTLRDDLPTVKEAHDLTDCYDHTRPASKYAGITWLLPSKRWQVWLIGVNMGVIATVIVFVVSYWHTHGH